MVSESKSVEDRGTAAPTQSRHISRHIYLLALTLALAYLLVIVYASVQPLRGWRLPAADVYGFLTAPWPRYITLTDVLVNVAAYIPLGFMLALGLRIGMPPIVAVAVALLLGVGLSIGMESVQLFLPSQRLGARLGVWRDRVFLPGAVTDVGVVVAVLWVITHLNPRTQVFGTGHLRDTFELPAYFFHTPGLFLSAEAMVVLFNLVGIGLLLSTLLRAEARRGLAIALVITAALACKMLITVFLAKPLGAWAWMTPGALLGFVLGATLLAGLLALGHTARLALALLAILFALAAINLAPDNPYFSLPPQLASGRASHLLSFSAILSALSELWPIIALWYLFAALWYTRYADAHRPAR